MAGRKTRGKGKGKAPAAIPDVYQDMLADVMPTQVDVPERPLKKRRTGRRGNIQSSPVEPNNVDRNDEDEDDVQFEDVLDIPKIRETNNDLDDNSEGSGPASNVKRQQTAYRDSDEESTEDVFDWDALDMGAKPRNDDLTGDLELTLTRPAASRKETLPRRRAITKAEKGLRIEIHKMHVLCLLAHLDRRNEWCNDSEVHKILKPLLTKKMLTFLRPKSSLSQFGRADSLKRGLDDVSIMWRTKFNITARGLRRSLWAEEEEHLHNYNLPADADPAFDKVDFIDAAKKLRGSRDLGAQLYCALLRSAGVDTRLVCSLQPLSFTGGGPSMSKPKSSTPAMKQPSSRTDTAETANIHSRNFGANVGGSSPAAPLSARRRLGHPNAADYHMPDVSAPIQPLPRQKPKEIIESPYPVFWVEVLDEAHQKWFPVDPLVTESIAKPRAFEPPLVDRENTMCYVIAFEEDGSARDVTKRYTKAFNAKTRKTRVESTDKGERWWRRAMKPYSRGWQSDLDQIEDTELAAHEAREPMPKNVADFKDHPYYALERHLKRNEILVATREVGKVAAGRDSTGVPGTKKLESIYRRRDVKVAKSADAWYRQGREVKIGEQPAKVVAARRKPDDDDELRDDMEESASMNLYTEDQTELYIPPPIVNGRVPKNSFGNLDIYVPSMVPQGGTHLSYAEASRAARLLNIDYADALTGFEFRGRHGTAILKGIVVATEYAEAVQAVIEGFRDEQARAEEEMRTLAALRMWKRFLTGLRIKERIDAYEVEGEGEETTPARPESVRDEDEDDAENNNEDMESEDTEYIDDYGGGFIPE